MTGIGRIFSLLLASLAAVAVPALAMPANQRLSDYGHADLFLAGDARTLVWQQILEWLTAH
ncbi:MAG TPA: hypothetical protein VHQ90_06265 [Thermoanaerobaculia bacterium]|nr:hypothetical protein [Thermoanaerobaculia bacterium]